MQMEDLLHLFLDTFEAFYIKNYTKKNKSSFLISGICFLN